MHQLSMRSYKLGTHFQPQILEKGNQYTVHTYIQYNYTFNYWSLQDRHAKLYSTIDNLCHHSSHGAGNSFAAILTVDIQPTCHVHLW